MKNTKLSENNNNAQIVSVVTLRLVQSEATIFSWLVWQDTNILEKAKADLPALVMAVPLAVLVDVQKKGDLSIVDQ